ncbi:MAG: AAA family ATPase, partial [Cyanobacteria bacterium P01_F01_bin.42]
MKEELKTLVKAQYPLIYLLTPEEERAEQAIARLAEYDTEQKVYTWTSTQGLKLYRDAIQG